MSQRRYQFLAAVLLAGFVVAPAAQAHGGRHYHGQRVGVYFGAPAYSYGWYGYRPFSPYYYPPAYIPPPVVVQPAVPPVYIERPDAQATNPPAQSYWYYCPDTKSYYPYVGTCASPWQRVAPQPQQAPQS